MYVQSTSNVYQLTYLLLSNQLVGVTLWLTSCITFDMVIFILTAIKTFCIYKAQKAIGMQSELVILLMRDGVPHESLNHATTDSNFQGSVYFM